MNVQRGDVQITSVTRLALEATHLLVQIGTPEGRQSGLRHDSVVKCVNILTLDKAKILRKLGQLPTPLMLKVDDCLKSALALP